MALACYGGHMPDSDDRDPRLVDLARAFADNCMVVRQRPEPGVAQRVTFPDGSVGERLDASDGPAEAMLATFRWRVTEGDNLARQWVEAELGSMSRAVEQRIEISSDLARVGMPWVSLEPPLSERVSVHGDTLTVSLWYPRNDVIQRIAIDLMDVRAADGLTILYDFYRDGWAIARDVTHDEDGIDALTGEVREVAFVPAWTDWSAPEIWNVAGVREGVRRSIAWLRDHGHEAVADELERETANDPEN